MPGHAGGGAEGRLEAGLLRARRGQDRRVRPHLLHARPFDRAGGRSRGNRGKIPHGLDIIVRVPIGVYAVGRALAPGLSDKPNRAGAVRALSFADMRRLVRPPLSIDELTLVAGNGLSSERHLLPCPIGILRSRATPPATTMSRAAARQPADAATAHRPTLALPTEVFVLAFGARTALVGTAHWPHPFWVSMADYAVEQFEGTRGTAGYSLMRRWGVRAFWRQDKYTAYFELAWRSDATLVVQAKHWRHWAKVLNKHTM